MVGQASIRRVWDHIVEFTGRNPALHILPVTDCEKISVSSLEIVVQVGRHTQEPLPFVHEDIELIHCEPGAVDLRVPEEFVLLRRQLRSFTKTVTRQRAEIVEIKQRHIGPVGQSGIGRQSVTVPNEQSHPRQVFDKSTQCINHALAQGPVTRLFKELIQGLNPSLGVYMFQNDSIALDANGIRRARQQFLNHASSKWRRGKSRFR